MKLSADEVQADDRYVYEVDGGAYTVNGTPPVGRVPWSGDFTVSAAGVTPIPLHAARHTYAEIALAAGVRLDVVSRQLGHASIATTGNIYTHDSDEAAQEAAACWGNFGGMREPGGR